MDSDTFHHFVSQDRVVDVAIKKRPGKLPLAKVYLKDLSEPVQVSWYEWATILNAHLKKIGYKKEERARILAEFAPDNNMPRIELGDDSEEAYLQSDSDDLLTPEEAGIMLEKTMKEMGQEEIPPSD